VQDIHVFRGKSGWVYLAITVLITGWTFYSFLQANYLAEAIVTLCNGFAICVFIWVFAITPKIIFSKSRIEIHNPFATVRIPWTEVVGMLTRYSLTIQTAEAKYASWAAPAPSIFAARRAHKADFSSRDLDSKKIITPSESPNSASGAAFVLALRYQKDIQPDTLNGTEKTINWLSVALMSLAILALLYNFVH